MTNDPWAPPVAADGVTTQHGYRAFALFGFSIATMLEGVLEAQRAEPSKRVAAVFAMASAATMWCIVDASSCGKYYPHSFRWITMFTWPVAVPIYLIHSRGGRGALLALGGLVGWLLAQVIGYSIGAAIYR